MPYSPRPLSRRSLILGAGGVAALGLTGCNASASPEAVAPAASGAFEASGFSYTDARGKQIALPAVPTVVVAQSSAAAALWDAGFKVKGAYGELKETSGKLDYQAGNLQLSELTVIGSTYGEFNTEKYAAMGPQLLIDMSFDDKTLWYVPADSATKIEAVAPTLGIKMLNKNLLDIIGDVMALADQLGADTTVATAAAKTQFEGSVGAIQTAVADQPELTVLAVSRAADKAYIANADQHPDLAYLKTLGVKFVDHGGKAEEYFTEISYEELDKYSGDLVISDARNYADQPGSDVAATWEALPAVKAGQVFAWKPAAPYSYAATTPLFADFAQALATSKPV